MATAQAQILAKTLLFAVLVGLVFVLGQGGYTGSTVGDFGGTSKLLGISILALCGVAAIILYVKYQKEMK